MGSGEKKGGREPFSAWLKSGLQPERIRDQKREAGVTLR